MKAITVRQPWARAIAIGAKNVENRSRPVSYRGLVAIHAGTTADTAADADTRIVVLFGPNPRLGVATGCVVAVAHIDDCHQTMRNCCPPWGAATHNGRPAWHIVLTDAVLLPEPVPARGHLAMPWNLPDVVAAQVEEQIKAVAA